MHLLAFALHTQRCLSQSIAAPALAMRQKVRKPQNRPSYWDQPKIIRNAEEATRNIKQQSGGLCFVVHTWLLLVVPFTKKSWTDLLQVERGGVANWWSGIKKVTTLSVLSCLSLVGLEPWRGPPTRYSSLGRNTRACRCKATSHLLKTLSPSRMMD